MKLNQIITGLILLLLNGCSGYPSIVNFPFDSTGRSLNSPATESHPEITSDYIVFVSDRNGSQDVYLYDIKNRRLLDLPGLNALNQIAEEPSISSDGRYLVFSSSVGGKSAIYLYDRETQQKRNLTENLSAPVRNPNISADGGAITFEVAIDGQWDILVYDRNGNPLDVPGLPR